mmetsp:Transcript_9132/g.22407  ORF Transcript_9132/g.22407 Transcript_9132/m.22407 type:complete len:94 (+) Transcript_9132:1825-2106(+)
MLKNMRAFTHHTPVISDLYLQVAISDPWPIFFHTTVSVVLFRILILEIEVSNHHLYDQSDYVEYNYVRRCVGISKGAGAECNVDCGANLLPLV